MRAGFKTLGRTDDGCVAPPERARCRINSACIQRRYRSDDDLRAIDGLAEVVGDLDAVGQLIVRKVSGIDSFATQKLGKVRIVYPHRHEMWLAAALEHNGKCRAPASRSEDRDLFHDASFLLSENFGSSPRASLAMLLRC